MICDAVVCDHLVWLGHGEWISKFESGDLGRTLIRDDAHCFPTAEAAGTALKKISTEYNPLAQILRAGEKVS